MDPQARYQPICTVSPASAVSRKLTVSQTLVVLQEEASERPFETVQPLAERLGMSPQEGERNPETGGNNVFDNRFEAEDNKVNYPDTGSHGVLCAGIHRLKRTRGYSATVRRAAACL